MRSQEMDESKEREKAEEFPERHGKENKGGMKGSHVKFLESIYLKMTLAS